MSILRCRPIDPVICAQAKSYIFCIAHWLFVVPQTLSNDAREKTLRRFGKIEGRAQLQQQRRMSKPKSD